MKVSLGYRRQHLLELASLSSARSESLIPLNIANVRRNTFYIQTSNILNSCEHGRRCESSASRERHACSQQAFRTRHHPPTKSWNEDSCPHHCSCFQFEALPHKLEYGCYAGRCCYGKFRLCYARRMLLDQLHHTSQPV